MKNYPKVSIGVGGLVLKDDGEVLFVQHVAKPDVWTIPSGYVQEDENLLQTIQREVKEETNTDIKPKGVVCLRQHVTPEGNNFWIIVMADYQSGEVTPDNQETVRVAFMKTSAALRKRVTPVTRHLLQALQAGKLHSLRPQKKLTRGNYEVFA